MYKMLLGNIHIVAVVVPCAYCLTLLADFSVSYFDVVTRKGIEWRTLCVVCALLYDVSYIDFHLYGVVYGGVAGVTLLVMLMVNW